MARPAQSFCWFFIHTPVPSALKRKKSWLALTHLPVSGLTLSGATFGKGASLVAGAAAGSGGSFFFSPPPQPVRASAAAARAVPATAVEQARTLTWTSGRTGRESAVYRRVASTFRGREGLHP